MIAVMTGSRVLSVNKIEPIKELDTVSGRILTGYGIRIRPV